MWSKSAPHCCGYRSYESTSENELIAKTVYVYWTSLGLHQCKTVEMTQSGHNKVVLDVPMRIVFYANDKN